MHSTDGRGARLSRARRAAGASAGEIGSRVLPTIVEPLLLLLPLLSLPGPGIHSTPGSWEEDDERRDSILSTANEAPRPLRPPHRSRRCLSLAAGAARATAAGGGGVRLRRIPATVAAGQPGCIQGAIGPPPPSHFGAPVDVTGRGPLRFADASKGRGTRGRGPSQPDAPGGRALLRASFARRCPPIR